MATVQIPEYPVFSSTAIEVDQTVLNSFATAYCAANPSATMGADPDFFYRYLPLESIELVFQPTGSTDTLAQLLGNVYVSGYFGGAWLRGILFGDNGQSNGKAAAASFVRDIRSLADGADLKDAAARNSVGWMVGFIESILADVGSQALADDCGSDIAFAQGASDTDVLNALPDHLWRMVCLCGYNLGFLLEMIKDTPPGVTLYTINQGGCLLDFSSPDVDIATQLLGNWNGVVPYLLQSPPASDRWSALQAMQTVAVKCEPFGVGVWKYLLKQTSLTGSGYATLFALGVKYQLLAQTITLAEMSAWANQDAGLARLALVLEACFTVWTGGFLIGRFWCNTGQPAIDCATCATA